MVARQAKGVELRRERGGVGEIRAVGVREPDQTAGLKAWQLAQTVIALSMPGKASERGTPDSAPSRP
jgi:hypothetical protein